MKGLRHIVAAIDRSPSSRQVLDRAARLAVQSGARLTVLHVVPLGALERMHQLLSDDASAETARMIDHARREVQQMADEISVAFGIPVDVQVPRGRVLDECQRLADSTNADLLVLGSKGMHPVRRWLLGATSERILCRTTRPVLVVKQPANAPYRRCLIPIDFSEHALVAVREARRVAPEAEQVLLHIAEVPFAGKLSQAGVSDAVMRRLQASAHDQARIRMAEFIQRVDHHDTRRRTVIEHGEVPSTIADAESEHACDLVVMGKRGMSLADDMLLGSVTRHVLVRASADVLIADRHIDGRGDQHAPQP
jgi:nucleotide-binding universal stress UspA family protein